MLPAFHSVTFRIPRLSIGQRFKFVPRNHSVVILIQCRFQLHNDLLHEWLALFPWWLWHIGVSLRTEKAECTIYEVFQLFLVDKAIAVFVESLPDFIQIGFAFEKLCECLSVLFGIAH